MHDSCIFTWVCCSVKFINELTKRKYRNLKCAYKGIRAKERAQQLHLKKPNIITLEFWSRTLVIFLYTDSHSFIFIVSCFSWNIEWLFFAYIWLVTPPAILAYVWDWHRPTFWFNSVILHHTPLSSAVLNRTPFVGHKRFLYTLFLIAGIMNEANTSIWRV